MSDAANCTSLGSTSPGPAAALDLTRPSPHSFPLSFGEIWRRPLPDLAAEPTTRLICRLILHLARDRILGVVGSEHILPHNDPFIVACNHSQRLEALVVPALLIFLRGGKRIHFLADWNFLLVPFVGTAFRRSQVIVVGRKSARPALLNHLRPWLVDSRPSFRRALDRLAERSPVGIFPEGTVNRNAERLLPGELGAARLSLHSGAPVVPLGIRFKGLPPGAPIHERLPFSIEIGPPLTPPVPGGRPDAREARRLHSRLMRALAHHCGKRWQCADTSEQGEQA